MKYSIKDTKITWKHIQSKNQCSQSYTNFCQKELAILPVPLSPYMAGRHAGAGKVSIVTGDQRPSPSLPSIMTGVEQILGKLV